MTYNIMNGFDYGKDIKRFQRTASWIQSQHPDILALQELCDYTDVRLQKEAVQWGHHYSALLKTEGYSVGVTSKFPITIIERIITDMWHGMLHCQIQGIDVFIVHFSPDDYEIRRSETDIVLSRMHTVMQNSKKGIILGDFNARSPFDDDLSKKYPVVLKKDIISNNQSGKYKNLMNDYFDYSVISKFLAFPLIDVCQKFVPPARRFTYSTPILIGSYRKNIKEVKQRRQRIDYIFVTPQLAPKVMNAVIINGKETGMLSDHYPIIADLLNPY
ncbi:endonuclease/exonuclease/phosphatase family protein [Sphingobacterium kitahiroshimense]|uniref:Endonuclease/exonuclease/phosphatase family protein n=1 Tax=Sphingobacterium kitahiroshimense TaxID=470446 RepID=A0ABV0BT30_9SPHI